MRDLIAYIVIVGFCFTDGFLFGPKYKDACDPNPCKNKALCKLDPKNKDLSTCECLAGFYGKNCEQKTGCSTKPCKKGTCEEDKINPSNYTCKCLPGYVGKNCDAVDACFKSPCKSGSKCVLDAKLKPVCLCNPGWMSKNCDKRNCTVVEFKGKNFDKTPRVYVDQTILKKYQDLDALAKICGVRIKVSRSFSLQPDFKSTADNNNAPFYIGRGLQFELLDSNYKLLCNSICLGKSPIPDTGAKCLINGLNAIGWKSSAVQPGVIHDGIHVTDPKEYNLLKEYKQVGCKDMKF